MATYTQIIYHLIFSTKNRDQTLSKVNREQLFRYIWGILKNKKCMLYQINGVDDHIHLITHLHPTIALSDLIKDIKVGTSHWIKDENVFTNFSGWQEGYGAFTLSLNEKEEKVNYVKHQETHHKSISFEEEYRKLLQDHGIVFDERYLL